MLGFADVAGRSILYVKHVDLALTRQDIKNRAF